MLALKQVRIPQLPTFRATAALVAGAVNKPMIGVVNTGALPIAVWQVWVRNAQTTAITGIIEAFELKRIVSVSGHTVVTPLALDTNDTVPAGLLCFTGGTVTGEATGVLARQRFSSDEWAPGVAPDVEADQANLAAYNAAFSFGAYPGAKPLLLRTNQGVMVACRGALAQGTWDLEVELGSVTQ